MRFQRTRVLLLALVGCAAWRVDSHALPWPFDPQAQAPNVANSFGDWNDEGFFHDGVDLPSPIGTTVKSVAHGCIANIDFLGQPNRPDLKDVLVVENFTMQGNTCTPTEIGLGGWFYEHVDSFPGYIVVGSTVDVSQILGFVADFRPNDPPGGLGDVDHLHFSRWKLDSNSPLGVLPLEIHPFNYYAAAELPPSIPVLHTDDIEVVKDKDTALNLIAPKLISV